MIMDFIEQRALAKGCVELPLDTSEKALHLIEYYSRRGYRIVEEVDWDVTN